MIADALRPPVVLVIAGHDPTGGAGIQADIETIASLGGHAVSLLTALTAQNTARAEACRAQPREDFERQAALLLEDIAVQACKIGLLGNAALAEATAALLAARAALPVVLDPVLAAGTGDRLGEDSALAAMLELLVPRATVLTPNLREALTLCPGAASAGEAAAALIERGAALVLITGGDEQTEAVTNVLYGPQGRIQSYTWARLPGVYHGSGCTLSAAIATFLALGAEPVEAVGQAQQFTQEALRHAYRFGHSQLHPNRFFRLRCAD